MLSGGTACLLRKRCPPGPTQPGRAKPVPAASPYPESAYFLPKNPRIAAATSSRMTSVISG